MQNEALRYTVKPNGCFHGLLTTTRQNGGVVSRHLLSIVDSGAIPRRYDNTLRLKSQVSSLRQCPFPHRHQFPNVRAHQVRLDRRSGQVGLGGDARKEEHGGQADPHTAGDVGVQPVAGQGDGVSCACCSPLRSLCSISSTRRSRLGCSKLNPGAGMRLCLILGGMCL